MSIVRVCCRVLMGLLAISAHPGAAEAPVRGGYPPDARTVVAGPAEGMARARKEAVRGPATIRLERATLRLPPGMSFVPRDAARYFLALHGRGPALETAGIVFPEADWERWHAVLEHHAGGHVRDTDASWNADEVLAKVREIQARTNPQLRAAGLPEMEMRGWIEPPVYLRERHTLAWALAFRSLGPRPVDEANYVFFNLGRDGFFKWRVAASPEAMRREREALRGLWAALEFEPGHRHGDFRRGDRAATVTVRGLLPDR